MTTMIVLSDQAAVTVSSLKDDTSTTSQQIPSSLYLQDAHAIMELRIVTIYGDVRKIFRKDLSSQ